MALARAERLTFTYPEAPAPSLRRRLSGARCRARWWRCSDRPDRASRRCSGHSPASSRTFTAAASKDVSRSTAATRESCALPSSPGPSRASFRIRRSRSSCHGSFARSPSGSRTSARARTRSSAAHATLSPSSASEHLADRPVAELSGGELQRVCLASAVALRPKLLLLDEPTSQLDPAAADAFLEHVSALGIAVLISDHRPRRVLDACGSRRLPRRGAPSARRTRVGGKDWLASSGRSGGGVLERARRRARRAGLPVGSSAVRV